VTDSVFQQIQGILASHDAAFEVLRHEPVFTSQEAADVRGVSLSSGAKALICKADQDMIMFVMPANLRLASKAIRRAESFKSLRFANREEIQQLTGLQPGSIPPFGSLFGLPTWCDRRLADEPTINFNAGDHSISIQIAFPVYQEVETLRIGDYAET
jgi:Ala-tRNA(Pro) deacylase